MNIEEKLREGSMLVYNFHILSSVRRLLPLFIPFQSSAVFPLSASIIDFPLLAKVENSSARAGKLTSRGVGAYLCPRNVLSLL